VCSVGWCVVEEREGRDREKEREDLCNIGTCPRGGEMLGWPSVSRNTELRRLGECAKRVIVKIEEGQDKTAKNLH